MCHEPRATNQSQLFWFVDNPRNPCCTYSMDQRVYPRKTHREEIYCYLDGDRFDAGSGDISAGGLFLKTKRDIPIGFCVAMVFKKGLDILSPVYLLGRIVRKQEEPVPGVGLQWTKAITDSPTPYLAEFLHSRMGLESPQVTREYPSDGGKKRSVYRFPRSPSLSGQEDLPVEEETTAGKEMPAAPSESGSGASGSGRRATQLHGVDLDVVRRGRKVKKELSALPAHVVKQSDGASPGPLSVVVQRGDTLAPTQLAAVIEYRGRGIAAVLLGLGIRSMYLKAPIRAETIPGTINVLFEIPAKDGTKVPVTCACRLLYLETSDPPSSRGIELEIDHYEEHGEKGILWTYLKWLHFRSLKKS